MLLIIMQFVAKPLLDHM